MWFYRNMYKLNNYITNKHFVNKGYVDDDAGGPAMAILHSPEYFTSWFGSAKWESEVIDKLFSTKGYG